MKRLFVLDGHALCYRAYYAFIRNPLYAEGKNVSAIFGFSRMLFQLIREHNPEYLLVAFDPPSRSFRWELYNEYKAQRKKMPDELREQIDEIRRMLDLLNIPSFHVDGFEADDVLGTLAETFAGDESEVTLVTGDKDAYQLVNDRVRILAGSKGISDYVVYDPAKVKEKLGVSPEEIIDYMAITGDSSDNIPGVKGMGPKAASQLIGSYGNLESIYEHLEELTSRQQKLLQEHREDAWLSRELVTIRRDVPLPLSEDDMKLKLSLTSEARNYFLRLQMNSIVDDFFTEEAAPSKEESPQKNYITVLNNAELDTLCGRLKESDVWAVDTETTSTQAMEAELVGISFGFGDGEAWYLPLVSQSLFGDDIVAPDESLEALRPYLEDDKKRKIGQNIKYDLIVFWKAGIDLKGVYFDTMVAAYLRDPELRRHNMDELAMKYLNYRTITYSDLVGTGKKAVSITEVPLQELAEYAAEDADVTFRLYEKLHPLLASDGLEELFFSLEMPLVNVLARMEYLGVHIDRGHFASLSRENGQRIDEIKADIHRLAGREFNINSTRELAAILFDELKLPPQKKTKTGYSTDISVLEALKGTHEIVDHLIRYRTLSKLQSTYIETLPKLVNGKTGRIHTSYNQTVVSTGRLSSSDPNLQNIPVRDDYGRRIRHGFTAPDGALLLAADYSQIELRLAAHLSGDETMIRAFREGEDIHARTAAGAYNVPIEEVTSAQRRQAKILNFATIYGVSPFGLSRQADISVEEARQFIERYFDTYPGFQDYIDRTLVFARKHGYVETMLGRRRPVPEIDSDTTFRREGAERVAINMPIQGTSADMIKKAMLNIDAHIREKGMATRMIMQVHDELVFEVPLDEKDAAGEMVRQYMENALKLDVPVVVDMGWASNWEEAH